MLAAVNKEAMKAGVGSGLEPKRDRAIGADRGRLLEIEEAGVERGYGDFLAPPFPEELEGDCDLLPYRHAHGLDDAIAALAAFLVPAPVIDDYLQRLFNDIDCDRGPLGKGLVNQDYT